ncbi:PREDICTED: gustatory receptor for sugar taste 64f [Dufourea novaeangliae]|uniref:gustatory receptor for sugar taste 64f n=1 Tax=Dufourea novaeangliae TaxID=178035 RepID=UPI000766F4C5|nr:PREDICTED: gustatory receptor for sugar taste 64f [Dufourea novaeangliae]
MLRVPFVLGAGFNAGDSQGHHEEVTQEDLARSGPPGSRRATANDSPKPELRSPKGGAQFHKFNNLKSNLEATEMSGPAMPSGSTFHPQADSLHASMRPIIMLAQCFSIFPVCGVNTPDASYLRFTWRSPKIIYSAISFVGLSMMTIFNILRIISTGVNSTKMTTFVFNGTNIIASILFLRLAMQWPALMLTWEKLEKEFSLKHRKVSKTSLSSKFKIVTIIVMIFALVEHGSSVLHGSIRAQECAYVQDNIDTVGVYFQSQFPQVFSITSYSLWKGILVDIINILSTFSWNFVDLFLILISIALVEQFRQLNSRLYSIRGKAMPEWWWAEARNDYNHLASLTRQLDSHISIMVLLSFATDLYFICIQLLFSFNPMRGIIEKLYFGFSFGFLLARTTLVSLCAASIHDESLLPAPILYSVSGSSFSTERFGQSPGATHDEECRLSISCLTILAITVDQFSVDISRHHSTIRENVQLNEVLKLPNVTGIPRRTFLEHPNFKSYEYPRHVQNGHRIFGHKLDMKRTSVACTDSPSYV